MYIGLDKETAPTILATCCKAANTAATPATLGSLEVGLPNTVWIVKVDI